MSSRARPPEPGREDDPIWEELIERLDDLLECLCAHNQGRRDLLTLLEGRLVHVAWRLAGYNGSRAARQLGVPRKRVERRLRKYGEAIRARAARSQRTAMDFESTATQERKP